MSGPMVGSWSPATEASGKCSNSNLLAFDDLKIQISCQMTQHQSTVKGYGLWLSLSAIQLQVTPARSAAAGAAEFPQPA